MCCSPFSFSETLDPELVAAASAVASTLRNRSQAESELLKKLRQHETVTEAQKKGDVSNLGYVYHIVWSLKRVLKPIGFKFDHLPSG